MRNTAIQRVVGITRLGAGPAFIACLLTLSCSVHELHVADQLAAQGQWDEAVIAYRHAAKKDPFNDTIQRQLTMAKARAADQHYAEGQQYMKDHQLRDALSAFRLALGLDPSRPEYHATLADALRLKEAQESLQAGEKLQGLGRLDEALDVYERAVQLDPQLDKALMGIMAITAAQRAARVTGDIGQPITLRFQNAKLKEVFEILARAGGVNVLFDKEVRDEPITVFIKEKSFDEALNLILTLNGLFAKRVGSDTVLIMPNTKPKQDQFQDQMIRTFYLSNAKAKEMVNMVRTMLESKRVYVNEPLNTLVIRDTPAKLQLAERMILANDRREAEVELDVEVLEVNRTKTQHYGLNFAKAAGLAVVPPGTGQGISTASTSFTFQQLASISPQSYLFSIPTSLLLDFFKQESDAKVLASPKLRVLNNKQATVNIGDKQPVLLSTTNVLPGQAATGAVPTTSTVTSIEFKDTGVKLTVEPTIHLADEISLKLKVEVTRLGDLVTLQASPEIKQFRFGTRTAETVLNLKADEAVVLAGLIQDEERKTRVTIPGLGDIPVLGKLFSTINTEVITTEVILTITPHLIRNLIAPSLETQAFWSGTETAYATSPLFADANRLHTVKRTPSGTRPLTPLKVSAGGAAAPTGRTMPAPDSPVKLTEQPTVLPGPIAPQETPIRQEGAGSPEKDPLVLQLQPAEMATPLNQEFRLDLFTDHLERMVRSAVTVVFDADALDFLGAAETAAKFSTEPIPGSVVLTFQPDDTPVSGKGVAASLVFQAKAAGEFPIIIHHNAVGGAADESLRVTNERTLVRVHE